MNGSSFGYFIFWGGIIVSLTFVSSYSHNAKAHWRGRGFSYRNVSVRAGKTFIQVQLLLKNSPNIGTKTVTTGDPECFP